VTHPFALAPEQTRRRRFCLATLLGALAVIAAPAIASDRISMRVEVFGPLGLHVLSLKTFVDEIGDRYLINSDYATTGVAGLVIDQSTRATASGRLIPASAQPELFQAQTRRNGLERREKVDFYADGRVEGSSTAPPPDTVTPAAARGTVDNLTAYFRVERQLAAKGTCALTFRSSMAGTAMIWCSRTAVDYCRPELTSLEESHQWPVVVQVCLKTQ
jgi:hypothetical protein